MLRHLYHFWAKSAEADGIYFIKTTFHGKWCFQVSSWFACFLHLALGTFRGKGQLQRKVDCHKMEIFVGNKKSFSI